MNPTSAAPAAPPRKHRRSNITFAERNQQTVRFSKLRQYTDNLPAALLDALTSAVRSEVRAIRTAKGRGMTWQRAIQEAYDALDSITKATCPGEVAETILSIQALRKAEGSLFQSELTFRQQRVRLLLHLGRERRRVQSTAGTIHGVTREVRMPDQKSIEAFDRVIERLLEAAEIATGKPKPPPPRPLIEQMLEQQAREQHY